MSEFSGEVSNGPEQQEGQQSASQEQTNQVSQQVSQENTSQISQQVAAVSHARKQRKSASGPYADQAAERALAKAQSKERELEQKKNSRKIYREVQDQIRKTSKSEQFGGQRLTNRLPSIDSLDDESTLEKNKDLSTDEVLNKPQVDSPDRPGLRLEQPKDKVVNPGKTNASSPNVQDKAATKANEANKKEQKEKQVAQNPQKSPDKSAQTNQMGQLRDSLKKSSAKSDQTNQIGQLRDSLKKSSAKSAQTNQLGQLRDSLKKSSAKSAQTNQLGQLRDSLKNLSASSQDGQDRPKANKPADTKQPEPPDQSQERPSLKKEQGRQSSQNRPSLNGSLRSQLTLEKNKNLPTDKALNKDSPDQPAAQALLERSLLKEKSNPQTTETNVNAIHLKDSLLDGSSDDRPSDEETGLKRLAREQGLEKSNPQTTETNVNALHLLGAPSTAKQSSGPKQKERPDQSREKSMLKKEQGSQSTLEENKNLPNNQVPNEPQVDSPDQPAAQAGLESGLSPQKSPDKSAQTNETDQLRASLQNSLASDRAGQHRPKAKNTAETNQQERPDQSRKKSMLKKEQPSPKRSSLKDFLLTIPEAPKEPEPIILTISKRTDAAFADRWTVTDVFRQFQSSTGITYLNMDDRYKDFQSKITEALSDFDNRSKELSMKLYFRLPKYSVSVNIPSPDGKTFSKVRQGTSWEDIRKDPSLIYTNVRVENKLQVEEREKRLEEERREDKEIAREKAEKRAERAALERKREIAEANITKQTDKIIQEIKFWKKGIVSAIAQSEAGPFRVIYENVENHNDADRAKEFENSEEDRIEIHRALRNATYSPGKQREIYQLPKPKPPEVVVDSATADTNKATSPSPDANAPRPIPNFEKRLTYEDNTTADSMLAPDLRKTSQDQVQATKKITKPIATGLEIAGEILIPDEYTVLVGVAGKGLKAAVKTGKALKATRAAEYLARWGKKGSELIERAIKQAHDGTTITKFYGNLPSNYQVHHIIPVQALEKNEVVQAAVTHGFEFNAKANTIALPRTIHMTYHNGYNQLILQRVEKWAADNPGFTPQQARDFLERGGRWGEGVVGEWRENWKKQFR